MPLTYAHRQRIYGRTPSSLLTGLFAYWKLEDVNDSGANGLNLTNNNAATFASAKVNNGLSVSSPSSQYLSLADSTTLNSIEGHVTLTIAGWIFPASGVGVTWTAGNSPIVISRYTSGGTFNWFVARSGDLSADTLQFCVESGSYRARSASSITVDAWNFFVCQHDPDANEIKVSVAGGAFNTAVSFSNGMPTSTIGLGIGARNGGVDYFHGKIDELGIWTRLLTSDEITTLYNGGTGRTYPFS